MSFMSISDTQNMGCIHFRPHKKEDRFDSYAEIVEFIGSISDLFGYPSTRRSYENSLEFAKILQKVYPVAELKECDGTVYAVIQGVAYDAYGAQNIDLSEANNIS